MKTVAVMSAMEMCWGKEDDERSGGERDRVEVGPLADCVCEFTGPRSVRSGFALMQFSGLAARYDVD